MVSIHQYSPAAFREYLEGYRRRGAVIRATFLHHTWKPTAAQYRGLSTIEGIRQAHLGRDFRDIACHAYAAPDGTVFNARPPSVMNCACQAPDRPASEWPPELKRLSGGDESWMNAYGFGLETIGNFDEEDPTTSRAMATALDVLAMVHEIWDIPVEHAFFHRDVAHKSCPGTRVTRDWVHSEIRRRLRMPNDEDRPDVSAWAAPYVARARELGLMTGYDDGSFRGGEPLTREQLAIVLCRLLDHLEV